MPIAHVEESWQMAEFYNNKVLIFSLIYVPNEVKCLAKISKSLLLKFLRASGNRIGNKDFIVAYPYCISLSCCLMLFAHC